MPRIVLMGEPGSGKTTLANEVARLLGADIVEVSRAVIYPLAQLEHWPKEEALLEVLRHVRMSRSSKLSRERARDVFSRLKKVYSADFIARALHARHEMKAHQKTILFSGLRGIANAEYCRLHNDFLIYLEADERVLVRRLMEDRGSSKLQATAELAEERALYHTQDIKNIASLVVDTSKQTALQTAHLIAKAIQEEYQMCRRCVNTSRNPAITFGKDGLCHVCHAYETHFDKQHLKEELELLKRFKGAGNGGYDVMVGISGGKDSTATLLTIQKMGFKPLAFTFDLGYLPKTTISRAKEVAKRLGVDFEVIDVRPYIRAIDLRAYEKAASLYEEPFTLATKMKFIAAYKEGRKHYSVKCEHSPLFVRSCQLCRRMIIQAYWGEAKKRNIPAIVLGINEWTNLSAAQKGGAFRVSGVRILQPTANKPSVHVFHLPFLLQRTSAQTKRILRRFGWKEPVGEDFIESNSNSCLFARSTERMAKRLLGFHPDATRLAREVTVGFITKRQALKALKKIHPYPHTPRHVLEQAGILKKKIYASPPKNPLSIKTIH